MKHGVCRFDISMDDTLTVNTIKTFGQLTNPNPLRSEAPRPGKTSNRPIEKRQYEVGRGSVCPILEWNHSDSLNSPSARASRLNRLNRSSCRSELFSTLRQQAVRSWKESMDGAMGPFSKKLMQLKIPRPFPLPVPFTIGSVIPDWVDYNIGRDFTPIFPLCIAICGISVDAFLTTFIHILATVHIAQFIVTVTAAVLFGRFFVLVALFASLQCEHPEIAQATDENGSVWGEWSWMLLEAVGRALVCGRADQRVRTASEWFHRPVPDSESRLSMWERHQT